MSAADDGHSGTAPGTATATTAPEAPPSSPGRAGPTARGPAGRRLVAGVAALLGLLAAGWWLVPIVVKMLNTTSTDDAYVNGHVTFVAPRVPGQVARVLVDDNMRVSKGDLLVELDREPYQVMLDIKKAVVANSEADVRAAEAQVRSTFGVLRGQRWKLQTAMEHVDNDVALLRARVATLRSKEATRDRARADLTRAQGLLNRTAISREEFDQRREAERVADALANQAREEVSETRVSLGLPPVPEDGKLEGVPADLNQNFSGVREALAQLVQSVAQLGLPMVSSNQTPKGAIEEFIGRDKEGNIDRLLATLVPDAPPVRQAQAKLAHARSDAAEAELNLRYCEIRAEIDGVVTRRNVNPGNNVQAGQSILAVRSLTEIWIDANFKETQLADLRIGQRAEVEVDMYGSHRVFHGRVTGFTMGTGQTLAVLPAQNATGNFVKVVQRLPVRIELEEYDPDRDPLFAGLSATPYVFVKEPPQGPDAGKRLQDVRRPASTPSN